MLTIKLSIAADNEGCGRQLPHGILEWKGYRFIINRPVEEADFWVVYSKGKRETESCMVAPENTMFITGEPDSVYHYAPGYVKQFAKVLSCQVNLKHKNLINMQPAQPWHIGKESKRDRTTGKEDCKITEYTHTYDTLKVSNPDKTKLISVITSNKAFTKGHRERIDFVMKLKEHYGDMMDLYGWGFNDFANKWDVIAPYKYHIAIENCSTPHYWTEKLADTYLGNAFPFYYGCPNVDDYFDKEAYRFIDIHDHEAAIKCIDEAIKNNLYEKNQQYILGAKNLILDKYNLFNLIIEQISEMDPNANKKLVVIKSDTSFLDWKKFQIMGLNRIINKIGQKIKNHG